MEKTVGESGIAEKALEYLESNTPRFIEELKQLVRIPSVGFPNFPASEMERSARAVAEVMTGCGFENVEVLTVDGSHPYVYGDWLHAPGKPTVLLYAHHDVQPPGREELWKSPPFEPTERDGRLYGRGTADDKAGIVAHTSAVASYLKAAGKLPLNVKAIIEGEEEVGSDHLESFLLRYAERMKGDAVVITDAGNFGLGIPSVTTSLRGLVAADVEVKTADHPLHSGMWGGPLPDPVLALSKIIASLTDSRGRIAIPGIYDDVRPLAGVEQESIRALAFSEEEFRRQSGMAEGVGIAGGDEPILQKMWRLPSLSVNAIQASSRANPSNIINDSAWCRIGIRIVPDMNPQKTRDLLVSHLKKHAPWSVNVNITDVAGVPWWMIEPEAPAFKQVFKAAERALAKGYGKRAVFTGCGGSIPFVGPLTGALGGIPALLIGVEDPSSNPHSENESLHLEEFKRAIRSIIYLYQELGK